VFEQLKTEPDRRVERTAAQQVLALIVSAIGAVICGADDGVEIAAWGHDKLKWVRQFLE